MSKNKFTLPLAVLLLIFGLAACAKTSGDANADNTTPPADGRLSVVVTNFPEYDFVRQLTGDKADIVMLLKPGAESHSYEPTPQDILAIQQSDLFVYVGGESDAWVEGILESMDTGTMHLFKLMDCVDLYEEELVEGMQAEEEEEAAGEEEGPELDEHVWTSPVNAGKIVAALCDTLVTLPGADKEAFEANKTAYLEKLQQLDADFREVVSTAKRKEIIVGDRFPFRYFCEEYGLSYYAAFPGCATETEANPATVAFLIDKVKADGIPVVFHIELSNEQMANSIAEATGAKSALLNAVHNVTDADFKAGLGYLEFMNRNVEALKEALN
ncbi:MAG TPA: metal ABC transporter substrate-binding protein [Candidatus Acidoferrum sp.]|nr:metal ABC transporter substrate-binding protein [Candidatus Acidoferrum sp.]